MQHRQKIFFISAIVILAMIAMVEGIFILRGSFTLMLRNEPGWRAWTASVAKPFRSLLKAEPGLLRNGGVLMGDKAEKDNIVLQETAEDLENMQNQINRLFYEMTRDMHFARQNLNHQERYNQPPPPQFPDSLARLQSEIAHIFQRAHESRHNGILQLIERDWRNVDEISSMNMEEDGTNYVVTVSMPGFERNDINISLNGRILTVEAAAEHQQTALDTGSTCSGCFKTQIMLPNDITGESAQASYENSVLKIKIPRKPASNSLARKVVIM